MFSPFVIQEGFASVNSVSFSLIKISMDVSQFCLYIYIFVVFSYFQRLLHVPVFPDEFFISLPLCVFYLKIYCTFIHLSLSLSLSLGLSLSLSISLSSLSLSLSLSLFLSLPLSLFLSIRTYCRFEMHAFVFAFLSFAFSIENNWLVGGRPKPNFLQGRPVVSRVS